MIAPSVIRLGLTIVNSNREHASAPDRNHRTGRRRLRLALPGSRHCQPGLLHRGGPRQSGRGADSFLRDSGSLGSQPALPPRGLCDARRGPGWVSCGLYLDRMFAGSSRPMDSSPSASAAAIASCRSGSMALPSPFPFRFTTRFAVGRSQVSSGNRNCLDPCSNPLTRPSLPAIAGHPHAPSRNLLSLIHSTHG